MHAIKGIYQNGQIVLESPANWAEGTLVVVAPIQSETTVGIRDEDWPTTPEEIARLLELMDQVEPLELTPEEEAEWAAARAAQKARDLADFEQRADRAARAIE
jgi:hypothetical protein